jgi:hypothetical protein
MILVLSPTRLPNWDPAILTLFADLMGRFRMRGSQRCLAPGQAGVAALLKNAEGLM